MRSKECGSGVVVVVVVMFALLLTSGYVLSIGPAFRLFNDSSGILSVVYFPLIRLAENCELVDTAMMAYVELWQPPLPDHYP